MSEITIKQWVTWEKRDLHARATAKFVKVSCSFEADAQVKSGNIIVSGRSIMGLLMLAATKGTKLEIYTSGRDAEALMKALQELIIDLMKKIKERKPLGIA